MAAQVLNGVEVAEIITAFLLTGGLDLVTPRIAANWFGTGISTWRSSGLRKNWSIWRSTSLRLARNSCTTLFMVWRSETRR